MTMNKRIELFSELLNKYSEKFPFSDEMYNSLIDNINYWKEGKISKEWLLHEMRTTMGVIQSNPFYHIDEKYSDILNVLLTTY